MGYGCKREGVQAETFSDLGSIPQSICHLPLIQTLQIFSVDSWTIPLSSCLSLTKHHSTPDGLNFTFQTLNLRRHLATVHHQDSSQNHRLACHQLSLNFFFFFSNMEGKLPRSPVERQFSGRSGHSYYSFLLLPPSPSCLSSLMYLVVKMCPIVFYQACNRVCMQC